MNHLTIAHSNTHTQNTHKNVQHVFVANTSVVFIDERVAQNLWRVHTPFKRIRMRRVVRDMGNNGPMMTPLNENILRVTGHLCGEFAGPRWIPRKKGQWRGALMFSVICVWINGWLNNREAGDLRCYRTHYDVIVMTCIAEAYLI